MRVEQIRLSVGPRLFLKSRAWWVVTVSAAAFELSLIVWGGPALTVRRTGFFEAVPLAVIAQPVVVMLILYATGSAHHALERLAARPLWVMRLASTLGSVAIVGGAATVASAVLGQTGTLHFVTPALGFCGMYGIGLCASVAFDRRVAGVPALLPLIAPLTFDPNLLPASAVWSFIIAGDGRGEVDLAALVWLAVGVLATSVARRRG